MIFNKTFPKKQAAIVLKNHYQTIQSKEYEEDRHEQRLKKKSYMLSNLQPDITTNKFKKHSHTYNQSSIQFNKSEQRIKMDTSVKEKSIEKEEVQGHAKSISNYQESLPILDQTFKEKESGEYEKEMAQLYLLISRLYVKIKSYDSAMIYYKKCLNVDTRKVEAILELASLYYSRYNSKKCLQWLETSLTYFSQSDIEDERTYLDINYIKYHKSLILVQEGHLD